MSTLLPTRHNPAGAEHLFHEEQIKELVVEWQRDREPKVLDEILRRCEPALTGTLLARNGYSADLDELLNALRVRVWKRLSKYNPDKGRIFTFVSLIAGHGLTETWHRQNLQTHRYPAADFGLLEQLKYATAPEVYRNEILDDIIWRIYQTRTVCTDPHELESQRWLVHSFLKAEFKLRRHTAADATVIVHGLDPSRARKIHDYTMLEIRRTLLGVVGIPEVTPDSLRGTRANALRKYADRLSSEDFAKLIYLMRNLAPAIIDAPDQVLNGLVISLEHVLNGHPEARPLFSGNYR